MTDGDRLLHFTLGPVQSFVGQARRTRDLWAGSFLLSWLSGQAMKAVAEHGGGLDPARILFPAVENDALFVALTDSAEAAGWPRIGSLPNRFKARVPADFDPGVCRTAVQASWRALAEAVWSRYVDPAAADGNDTRVVWDRQIHTFWETTWVIGPDPGDGSDGAWLDQRKNWRSHRPPVEGGDHCMLMGDWQELSGFVRATDRDRQDRFWEALRGSVRSRLDLRPGERLCAIALVKRLFPTLPEDELDSTLGWVPGSGQQGIRAWPSVGYIAAVPWIKAASQKAPAECESYARLVRDLARDRAFNEYATRIDGLKDAGAVSALDGGLFFESQIDQLSDDELTPAQTDDGPGGARRRLSGGLAAIREQAGLGEVSPFYALLVMDGDRVGALLQNHKGSEAKISAAMGRFAGQVSDIMTEEDGVAIYAGGDDVLALLPIETAVPAALRLEQAFRTAFHGLSEAGISGAVVLAHIHVPLRAVIAEAHHQLDTVAKDQNGRGSLAISVLKSGGRTLQWVSTWQADGETVPQKLVELAKAFGGAGEGAHAVDEAFTSNFFYNLGERYGALFEGAEAGLIPGEDLGRILWAEYLKSRGADIRRDATAAEQARSHVRQLLDVCHRHDRPAATPASEPGRRRADTFRVDGPLLVRFLGREGIW